MSDIIATKNAPAAIGPYNQAVRFGNTLYCSGQIGLIPATGELAQGLDAQVHQAFQNLTEVVKAAGSSFTDVVKFTLLCDRHDEVRRGERHHAAVRQGPVPRPQLR